MGSLRKLVCLFAFSIAAIALTNDCSVAQRFDTCLLRRSFRCESSKPIVGLEKVAFRSLPFAKPIAVDVPASGRGLLRVIANQEAVSTLLNTTIGKIQKDAATANGQKEESDDIPALNPFFHGDSTPNAIVVIRGREVTVFPRVLLLHSEVRRALILPGDRIATFKLDKTVSHRPLTELLKENSKKEIGMLRDLNGQDPIHRWYSITISNKEPSGLVSISSAGLVDSPIAGGVRITDQKDLNGFAFVADQSRGGIREELKMENLDPVLQATPLVIELRRNVGTYIFRQIVPVEHSSLGGASQNYRRIFRPDGDGEIFSDENLWSNTFDSFTKVRLKDGDMINVLLISRIPLFSRLGL